MHKATLGSGKGGTLATGILTQRWPFFFFHPPESFLDESGLEMGLGGQEALKKQQKLFKQCYPPGMQ